MDSQLPGTGGGREGEPSAKTLREAKRLLEATRCLYDATARLFNAVAPTGADESIAYFMDKAHQLLSPEGEALPQPSEAEGSNPSPRNPSDTQGATNDN